MKRRSEAGFTLVELISVLGVVTMFSGLIIYFAYSYWRSTATLENDLGTLVSRLTAGDILREAINESSGMINQNSLADSNATIADPLIPSGDYWTPIHAVPAVISNGGNGTHTPVAYFRRPSVNTAKNVILNGSQPYEDEYVLYMDGTTKQLLLRTIANSLAAGNRAATSCPKPLATASCPGDRIIADNVSAVETRYFSRAGLPINYQSSTDPLTGDYNGPDYSLVEVVEFNLKITKKSTLGGGQDTSNETIIRVALRSS